MGQYKMELIFYIALGFLIALSTQDWPLLQTLLAILLVFALFRFVWYLVSRSYNKAEDQNTADEGLTEELRRVNSKVRKEEVNESEES